RIVGVNGKPVARMADMAQFITASPAGTRLTFEIDRGGRPARVSVTLGTRPITDQPFGEPLPPPPGREQVQEKLLGVRTLMLGNLDRNRLKIPVTRGALVARVTPGSPAARAGLPVDAVIVGLDNRLVESPEQLAAHLLQAG